MDNRTLWCDYIDDQNDDLVVLLELVVCLMNYIVEKHSDENCEFEFTCPIHKRIDSLLNQMNLYNILEGNATLFASELGKKSKNETH